jgi:hypothetical protein
MTTSLPDSIKILIDRFEQQADQLRSPDYNETQIRIDFINPLMSALGWDIDNRQNYAEQYREVVHEDRVKVAGQTKAPDYSFRIGGQRKFFLEAKKPSVNIKTNWEPAFQLRRYAWSAKLPCSLLTDFEEFAIYDCRIRPKHLDDASTARREFIHYTQYEQRWDFLYNTFSKEAVLQGNFDRYCVSKKGRGAQEFDDAFLTEIEEWREKLASNLALRNASLDQPSLNFAVQRIIDRIIFLRIAEDRGTENTGQLQALLNGSEIYPRLCELFRRADERYNSGLFHFQREKDRDESPDTLTPTLTVDDKALKAILERLYYPQSPYEFTMVTADILGSVYERFLGKVITLSPSHRVKIEEKPEVRKAGGVYYTPDYIVRYIVTNTVGKLLEGKTPSPAPRLKILDPACGSGSFLIGAYQFLLDWYLLQYTTNPNPEQLTQGKRPVLRPGTQGGHRLTIAERKRILLDHIHGVDLDHAAVEVTKLNLLLKCLEGETSQTLGFEQRLFRERALPDLGNNIKCGNSLIGTDIIGTDAWNAMSDEEKQRVNPFDYATAFPQVFKHGGFDAVIGNPPYIQLSMEAYFVEPIAEYLRPRFSSSMGRLNTFGLFFERSARQLVRNGGSYGYIVPNTMLSQEYYTELRQIILADAVRTVAVHSYQVFDGAVVEPAVIVCDHRLPKGNVISVEIWTNPTTIETTRSIDQDSVVAAANSVFLVNASDDELVIRRNIDGSSTPFGSIANINQAIALKGDRAASLRETKENADCVPVIDGREIKRYQLSWSGSFLEYDVGKIHSCKRRDIFDASSKLFFRRVGEGLMATYDDKQFYALNTLVVLTSKPSYDKSLKAMLGWFNSRCVDWYFTTFLKSSKRTFSEIQARQVAQLPFPTALVRDETANQKLAALVDSILTLHKKLSTETLPQRREQLEREIAATDRQIDQLVYELYGLTPEEIKIVEDATA